MMKVKIGIVGLGEHSLRAHVKHLINDSRVEIVAVFDPDVNSENNLKEYISTPLFFTDENKFWKTHMDAVIIASPDKYHAQQMSRAIELGLHIFCEKPMCVSMEDLAILNKVVKLSQEKNLVLSTCHPRRLDPPFIWLKEKIDNGELYNELGSILHFDFNFWYKKIQDTPEDEWKKKRSLLSDHFGHEIDLLAFLCPSEINDINAIAHMDSYNHYEVTGSTETELKFRFLGLRMINYSVYEEVIQLNGQKGSWILNLSHGKLIKVPSMEVVDIPSINYDVRFSAVNINFIDAILGVNGSYITHEDILRNNTLSVYLQNNKVAVWNS